MPLRNGYGVVIGTVDNHFIESPDSEGRWPHYHIMVNTPAGIYKCVVNLKSRTKTKIEYKEIKNLTEIHFTNILSKPDGFHRLEPNSESGALDFIRHPGIENTGIWKRENGTNVIQVMQSFLKEVKRVYIFGEPYDRGELGIHNVHMNQGDKIGSVFAIENGIWQDGGVMFEYEHPNQQHGLLLTKFEGQRLNTDDFGRPIQDV